MSRKHYGYYDRSLKQVVWIDPDGEIPSQRPPEQTSAAIRTDEIPPTESMATSDRRIFTSLAKLDRHYAEHGYERCSPEERQKKPPAPKKTDPRELRDMAEKAFMDIKYDRVPISEKEREICRQEERRYQDYYRRNR